jgi:hypothetical protein
MDFFDGLVQVVPVSLSMDFGSLLHADGFLLACCGAFD